MILLVDALVSMAARFIADLKFSTKTFIGSDALVCLPTALKNVFANPKQL